MKHELIEALEQLEKEKGISKDVLIETIKSALTTAYKKNFGAGANVKIDFNEETGEVKVYSRREVVEEMLDFDAHIELEDAKEIDPNFKIGDFVDEEVTPKDFGRIAAQTARQVVVQRIREAERTIIFDEYCERESEIINGEVQRMAKGTIYINLGKTEAVLMPSEQIPFETYEQGARLKTYIIEVKKTSKGPQIIVSRTHPGLVKRLFELEVPEIHDGEVEIKGISREAGSRTKIAVYSENEEIDPVGACVGQKGVRVQNIVTELKGEKIDIIKWSEDPVVYISNSLSPSQVDKVEVDEEAKSALVVVPDNQLSLAIGKEGQNARLAAKLTGWKIDIKSASQYATMESMPKEEAVEEVEEAEVEVMENAADEVVEEETVETVSDETIEE